MRRPASVLLAIVLLAVGATSASAAPIGNSVTGSGTLSSGGAFSIDARSGPAGESPSGTVTVGVEQGRPVVGLEVIGNYARVTYATDFPFGPATNSIIVIDGPDLLGSFNGPDPIFGGLSAGSITVSDATPPPAPPTGTTDSVVGTATRNLFRGFRTFRFDARSGPGGESPTGSVVFDSSSAGRGPDSHIEGPVTCLKVAGNTAIIGSVSDPARSYLGEFLSSPRVPISQPFIYTVVSIPGSAINVVAQYEVTPEVARSCDFATQFSGARTEGRTSGIVISDGTAPAAARTKAECKRGGFARFGLRNQGACVSAVARRGGS